MFQKDQAPLSQSLPSHLKVRRIWTYTDHPASKTPIHQTQNGESFQRAQTQINSQISTKKTKFISSIINKIKNVERTTLYSSLYKSPDILKHDSRISSFQEDIGTHVYGFQNGVKSKISRSKNINSKAGYIRDKEGMKLTDQEIELMRQDNIILKSKLNELILQNERLKMRITHYNADYKEVEDRLQSCQIQLSDSKKIIQNLEMTKQTFQIKAINEEANQQAAAISQQQNKYKFSIQKVIQITLTLDEGKINQLREQIRQLQLEKLQLEKKFTVGLNKYRKKHEEQIQKLKRTFASNLNHYKQMLFKLSSKGQPRKFQEDTFETAILQTSSADES